MAGLTCDPFGETPAPRWRTQPRPRENRVPKRYAIPASALGSLSGLAIQHGDGLDKPTRFAIVTALTLIPPFLVDRWWSGRRRRQQEQLFVLPDSSRSATAANIVTAEIQDARRGGLR